MNKMSKYDIIIPKLFGNEVVCGVVEANYSENNTKGISFKTSDYYSLDEVGRNIRKIIDLYPGYKFIFQEQTHSDMIKVINEDEIEDSFVEGENSIIIGNSDAMITDLDNVILSVYVADCGGVLIYEKVNRCIAAVHSGWQGSLKNIVGKTIIRMGEEYGSRAKDLLVYLSPCASVDNFEVGDEFKEYFPKSVREFNGKLYFNNKKEIKLQLLEKGVIDKNIEISSLCTISNKNLHSFRRDKEKSGRMAVFIGKA